MDEAKLRPIQLANSGPAGGVLAATAVARQMGCKHAVTMDIGGTSTDICIMFDGEIQHREIVELEHGIPARIRSLDIHAIGAGGGSIVYLDAGGAVRVGPRSAGAVPGPACYGRGGPAAVTDANLVHGVLPETGLLGGNVPLDRAASRQALGAVAGQIGTSVEQLAEGVWAIVNANIAQAIREITVQQGTDIREFALVAFGGAGPQHAVGVAAELGHQASDCPEPLQRALGDRTAHRGPEGVRGSDGAGPDKIAAGPGRAEDLRRSPSAGR